MEGRRRNNLGGAHAGHGLQGLFFGCMVLGMGQNNPSNKSQKKDYTSTKNGYRDWVPNGRGVPEVDRDRGAIREEKQEGFINTIHK